MQIINWTQYWAFTAVLVTIYYAVIYLFIFRGKKIMTPGANPRPVEKIQIENKKDDREEAKAVAANDGEDDLSPPWS